MAQSSLARAARPESSAEPRARSRLARYAWLVVGYTLFVILFGAVVRITGSGAGCGQHWPSCNGEVLRLPHTLKTGIEYTHRATSGLSLIAILGLLVATARLRPRPPRVLWTALFAFFMVLVEALVGRALVRFSLVENDASLLRAIVMPIHLIGTSLLMAGLVLTAFWLSVPALASSTKLSPRLRWVLWAAALGVLIASVTGAITALGDTVFPVHSSGLARYAEDQGASAHLLQRVRVLHPLLAVAAAGFLTYTAISVPHARGGLYLQRFGSALVAVTALQIVLGAANVWFSAPGVLQVVHLAVANLVWLVLVLFSAAAHDGV